MAERDVWLKVRLPRNDARVCRITTGQGEACELIDVGWSLSPITPEAQAVLDAACAYRDKGNGTNWEALRVAVDEHRTSLRPAPRYEARGNELWVVDGNVNMYQCRVQLSGATNKLAEKIAEALNRADAQEPK